MTLTLQPSGAVPGAASGDRRDDVCRLAGVHLRLGDEPPAEQAGVRGKALPHQVADAVQGDGQFSAFTPVNNSLPVCVRECTLKAHSHQGPIHTGRTCANSNTNPLTLLASSVDTPIHVNRFYLFALRLRIQCALWPNFTLMLTLGVNGPGVCTWVFTLVMLGMVQHQEMYGSNL